MKRILFFVVAMVAAISAIASDQFYVITRDASVESTPSDNVYNPQIDKFMGVNDLASELIKLKKEVETLKGYQWNGNGLSGTIDEHEYVDLGLPSGLKWATMNIGAKKASDCGTYFAWGETEPAPRNDYSEANCKVNDESSSSMKSRGVYANDELTAKYDAATQNWGKNWEMPSESQFYELMVNCRWTWTTLDGVKGYKVESKAPGNTNWIFLPAGGYYDGTSSKSVGSGGHYWTSTCYCKPESVDASDWIELSYSLNFDSYDMDPYYFDHRYRGFCVRPVCKSEYSGPDTPDTPDTPISGYVDGNPYVDLGLPSGLKWATTNIGAKKANDYGTYFAWGSTAAPLNNNYISSYCNTYDFTKFVLNQKGRVDDNGNLVEDFDAATQNWGENWRMPTKEDFEELINNCTWTRTELDGVEGYKVESKVSGNTNWIFLPFSGCCYNTSISNEGSFGYYWSSTAFKNSAYDSNCLLLGKYVYETYEQTRYYGLPVRPVVETYPIYMIMKDGSVKNYESLKVDSISFEKNESYNILEFNELANEIVNLKKEIEALKSDTFSVPNASIRGDVDGYEYVDLGLPSGLKWATMNVGAKKENDYGTYFAWGEIAPAPDNKYSEANCKAYGKSSSSLESSGVIDANGHLSATYDAATQNWSKNWRMPTKEDFEELLDNCEWTWTELGGVNGYKVASYVPGNTNWIFLPAAGYRYDTFSDFVGSGGNYWSSTVNEGNSNRAYYLDFYSSGKSTRNDYRYYGHTVRPVTK